MLPADEIEQVRDGLWFWQRHQPSVKVDCSSCALLIDGKLILVDPIPLATDALEELTRLGKPAAIIATNGNHDRASSELSVRFGAPLFAHAEAAPTLGLQIARTLIDGELLFGALTVVSLPGAGPGEIALHDARGWMLVGDAVINLESSDLAILPDKYCSDASEMRVSLRKLLRFEFEVLTFAHGLPLAVRARPRLEALLA